MKDHRNIGVVVPLLLFVVLLSVKLTFEQTVVVPLSSRTERFALFGLRSSLGIRSKEWPRKPDPCSFWKGVTCDGNGRVVGINISGFRRTRLGSQNPQFAVDALGNFTLLKSFNASRFALPGSIPEWFGDRLVSLEVLDLSSCLVRNGIPPGIGNLTNLTTLNLADNNLTGVIPSSIVQLSRLSLLNLSWNSLSGSIPSSFVPFSNISMLDVSSNSLSGSIPLALRTLSGLQYLNLSRNVLSSSIPPQLGDLSNLVDLDLSFNSLSGQLPSELRGLRSLRRMFLGNNILNGSLPENLFLNLSQLQTVVLRNNDFSGNISIDLWSLPALLLLDVSGNNFTGLLPNTNSTVYATVAVLNISQNQLYGNITEQLRRFGFLDLFGNYFEGKVPDFAQTNSSLGGNCLQNATNQRTRDDCSSFYTRKGLTFDNFGQPNSTAPAPSPAEEPKRKSHRTLYILIGVLGGLGLIVLLLVLICAVVICIRKRSSANDRGVDVGAVPGGETAPTPGASVNIARVGDAYTYQQLLHATDEFSDLNLIKKGHSGDLFKGVLDSGVPVVVKKINLGAVKKESYAVELDFFSKVSHGRFVPFIGHCLENENENEKFLIYKYMPNEDLGSSLYKKTSDDDSLQSLDWIKRLKIAVGAAEALSYLHHECNPPLVHRDVQASSILLDDKYEVRMGSLSEVCAQEGDTHQSRISRLLRLPQSSEAGTSDSATANCAYDVYCFGKVLLELVTGKLGISASTDAEIKEWLEQTLPCINIYDKELVTKIVDPLLIVDEDLLEEVWAMAIIARSCLNPKPTRRPPMRYVHRALENPLKIVREENTGSGRLRATSSRGSWNAALFGSWRHSSSDVAVIPASSAAKAEGASSFKQSGTTGSQSQGSGPNGSSSHRRYSKEIFPEPPDPDVERQDQD